MRHKANIGAVPREAFYHAVLDFYRIISPEHRQLAIKALEKASSDVTVHPRAAEILTELKLRGVKVGVVTNSSHPSKDKLAWMAGSGLDKFEWDTFTNSCEVNPHLLSVVDGEMLIVGIEKPQPGIYEKALLDLNLPAADCYFVGHTQRELNGAKRLGMTTVLINPEMDAKVADYYIETLEEILKLPFESQL